MRVRVYQVRVSFKRDSRSCVGEISKMAFNSSIGTEQEQQSVIGDAGLVSAANGVLTAPSETTSLADVVESSVESLFQWATVAESSTFGLIWLMAVIGNGLITCTLLRRGLLTHPSNRFIIYAFSHISDVLPFRIRQTLFFLYLAWLEDCFIAKERAEARLDEKIGKRLKARE